MCEENLILDADSYKDSHWMMLPPDTQYQYSYLESRGGRFPSTVFFGLQPILRYLSQPITKEMIDEAEELTTSHLNNFNVFNRKGWEYILEHHNGFLPLEIKAVPEGTKVENSNILMSIVNTDPAVPWLGNYFETCLMRVWYPCFVSTFAHELRNIILPFLIKNGTPSDIDFKLHDFGARSGTSKESVQLAGAAHLLSFKGTDNKCCLPFIRREYGPAEIVAGFSVAASEHSTITSWGRPFERTAYQHILNAFPEGIVSIVSDSYDIFNACENIFGKTLKNQIIKRHGTLVIRPDSGDIIPTALKVLSILGNRFGWQTNNKGYKVLPEYIRILQGDGMNFDTIPALLLALDQAGMSSDNIATMGMGTKLHMDGNRDTQKMAFKASAVHRGGAWQHSFKDPITDSGKQSKRGRLALMPVPGGHRTIEWKGSTPLQADLLRRVYLNGNIVKTYTYPEVRQCLNSMNSE